MILSSSIPNPIPPFSGPDVTLTCAVELSPAVDVPVTVNTALTRPTGFTIPSTTQPVMGSSTNYTTTSVINSFGRSDSGTYFCAATISLTSTNAYISDSSTATHSVRVTTGEICIQSCSRDVLIITAAKFLRCISCTERCTYH